MTPLLVAAALLVSFVLIPAKTADPLMALHIFARRNRYRAYAMRASFEVALFLEPDRDRVTRLQAWLCGSVVMP
jgi:hypothetical protein